MAAAREKLLLGRMLRTPRVMGRDIFKDLQWCHSPPSELNVGFGIISGCKVDFGGAFVIQSDLGFMIVKAPIR